MAIKKTGWFTKDARVWRGVERSVDLIVGRILGMLGGGDVELPVANEDRNGLMSSEAYKQVAQNARDILRTQDVAFRPLGTLAYSNDWVKSLADSPSISNVVMGELHVASILQNDAFKTSDSVTWVYALQNDGTLEWVQWGGDSATVVTATNESLGIVKGDLTANKVRVLSDGSMACPDQDARLDALEASPGLEAHVAQQHPRYLDIKNVVTNWDTAHFDTTNSKVNILLTPTQDGLCYARLRCALRVINSATALIGALFRLPAALYPISGTSDNSLGADYGAPARLFWGTNNSYPLQGYVQARPAPNNGNNGYIYATSGPNVPGVNIWLWVESEFVTYGSAIDYLR